MESGFEYLHRIAKFMASMTDMDKLLGVIINEASIVTNAESCSLALYDEPTDELYFYIARGTESNREVEQKLECFRMKMGEGVVGWCAANMETANIRNAIEDPRFCKAADEETGFVTRSILAVPMKTRDKLIGVVEAVNKQINEGFSEHNEFQSDGFTDHDEKVLSVLATQASLIIENARLYQESIEQARLSALGQGIAGAAHCIKNILNSIDGGGYIIELGIQKENIENIDKGWDILKRNTLFMKELVLDMLTCSRPRKPEYEPSDINTICSDIANLVGHDALEKNVDVQTELQSDIGIVILDPKSIYRCVLNLVTNAIDACDKPKGIVKINTNIKEDNMLEITVSDNGCGISEENIEKIFKVFYSTKGNKGTGLGLGVTEKIIAEHGGNIKVESKIGEGTSFIISIPAKGIIKNNSHN